MKTPRPCARSLNLPAALLLAVCACSSAAAQGTLDRIRQSGAITVGHQDAAFPFAYYDDRRVAVGYSLDVCRRVVEAIRDALRLKTLAVTRHPALPANRAALLSRGTIDLDCGPVLIAGKAAPGSSFSPPYFIAHLRFLFRRSAGLSHVADLKGKPVLAIPGTRSLREIIELNERRQLGLSIGRAKTERQAFQAVAQGHAMAFFSDDVTLHALIAESGNRRTWEVSREALATESYGLMMGRDDPQLAAIVDSALRALYRSGELGRIHDKWFLGPARTRDGTEMTLGLPMGDALGRALSPETGTDKPRDR